MIRDLNIRKVMKNAFRITKTKYKTALRVRVPGGLIDPECLMLVQNSFKVWRWTSSYNNKTRF